MLARKQNPSNILDLAFPHRLPDLPRRGVVFSALMRCNRYERTDPNSSIFSVADRGESIAGVATGEDQQKSLPRCLRPITGDGISAVPNPLRDQKGVPSAVDWLERHAPWLTEIPGQLTLPMAPRWGF